jgi:hypothetical protein
VELEESRFMQSAARPLQISIGPRVRKSPFFDATLRYGAEAFTVYNHTYMPTKKPPHIIHVNS